MNSRFIVGSLLAWSLNLISPSDALACVCLGEMPTIESQVASAPFVVAARVIAAEPLKEAVGQRVKHIAAIRVEVVDVLRGDKNTKEFRVWDQFVGSSCSLDLIELPVGTLLVIALNPKQERRQELWELVGIKPEPSDYVFGTCQEHWRIFSTESELRRYVRDRSR